MVALAGRVQVKAAPRAVPLARHQRQAIARVLEGQSGGRAVHEYLKAVLEGLLAERAAAFSDGQEQGGRRTGAGRSGQGRGLLRRRLVMLQAPGLFLQDEPVDVPGNGGDRAQ